MTHKKETGSLKTGMLAFDILESFEDYKAYKKGEPTEALVYTFPKTAQTVDVKAIRSKLGMTQEQFTAFGFSISAIRHWESKRRIPEGSARVLLKVIEDHPHIVLGSLNMSENFSSSSAF